MTITREEIIQESIVSRFPDGGIESVYDAEDIFWTETELKKIIIKLSGLNGILVSRRDYTQLIKTTQLLKELNITIKED